MSVTPQQLQAWSPKTTPVAEVKGDLSAWAPTPVHPTEVALEEWSPASAERKFTLPPASPISLPNLEPIPPKVTDPQQKADLVKKEFTPALKLGGVGRGLENSWVGRSVLAAQGRKPAPWADPIEDPREFGSQMVGTLIGDGGVVAGVEKLLGRALPVVGQGTTGLLKHAGVEGGKRALAYGGLESAVQADEVSAGTREEFNPLASVVTGAAGALGEVFPFLKMWSMRKAVPAGPGPITPPPSPSTAPRQPLPAPEGGSSPLLEWKPPRQVSGATSVAELEKGSTREWLKNATPEDFRALTPEARSRAVTRLQEEEAVALQRFLGRPLTKEELQSLETTVTVDFFNAQLRAFQPQEPIPLLPKESRYRESSSDVSSEVRNLKDYPDPVIADLAGKFRLSSRDITEDKVFLLTNPQSQEAEAIRHMAADLVGQEGEVSGMVALLPDGTMIKSPKAMGLTSSVVPEQQRWLEWIADVHPNAAILDMHAHPDWVYQSGYASPGVTATGQGDAAWNQYLQDTLQELNLRYLGGASITRRFYDLITPSGERLIAAHGLDIRPQRNASRYEMGRTTLDKLPAGTQGLLAFNENGEPIGIIGLRDAARVPNATAHAYDLKQLSALYPEAAFFSPVSNHMRRAERDAWEFAIGQVFGDDAVKLPKSANLGELPVLTHQFVTPDSSAAPRWNDGRPLFELYQKQGPGYALNSAGEITAYLPSDTSLEELLYAVAANRAMKVTGVGTSIPEAWKKPLYDTGVKLIQNWRNPSSIPSEPNVQYGTAQTPTPTLPVGMTLADLTPTHLRAWSIPVPSAQSASGMPPGERKSYTAGLGSLSHLMAKPLQDFGRWALTPIADRLNAISPTLGFRLAVRYESDLLTSIHDSLMQVVPFQKAWKDLPPELKDLYAMRLYNDLGIPDDAPPALREAWGQVQDLLEQFAIRLKIPTDRNYFPRMLKSYEDLQAALNPEAASKLNLADFIFRERAEGEIGVSIKQLRTLSQRLKSLRPQDFRPGFLNSRAVGDVSRALLPFYLDPVQSIATYARLASTLAERQAFFGPAMVLEDGKLMLMDSIERFAMEAAKKGELTPENLPEVKRILATRFGPGEQAMNRLITSVKDLWLLELLAQWKSAITQFGDIGPVIVRDGWIPALSAVLSPEKRALARSLGLDKRYGVELETKNPTLTSRALQWGLDASGFAWVDMTLKGVNLISSAKKWQKMLKTAKGTERFLAEWMPYLDEDVLLNVMKALDEEDFHHPGVRYLLFSDLRKTQPISRSEMPEAYLAMRNGRTLYTLKSYTIKQLNFLRQQALEAEKKMIANGSGPVVGKSTATLKLLYAMSVLALMGASIAELQDWLFNGKDDGDFLDEVAANALKLFGASPWAWNQIAKAGEKSETTGNAVAAKAKALGSVAMNTVTPPVGALLYPLQEESRLRAVPIVGTALHGWTREDEGNGPGPFMPKSPKSWGGGGSGPYIPKGTK